MNYSKQFSSYDELTDKNISDLQNLKFNHQQDDPNHLEYVDICKKQCMIGKLQDLNSSYDLNKDLDIPKDILNENIEYVKRQSEIKMKQDIKKEFSKEKKSNYFSGIVSKIKIVTVKCMFQISRISNYFEFSIILISFIIYQLLFNK